MRARLAGAGPVAAALAVLLLAAPAAAHDPGLSELVVTLGGGRARASWWFDRGDLTCGPAAAAGALALELDGAAAAPLASEAHATWDGHCHLEAAWSGAPRASFRLAAPLLERLSLGHMARLRVQGADGRTLGERMLRARNEAYSGALGDAAN